MTTALAASDSAPLTVALVAELFALLFESLGGGRGEYAISLIGYSVKQTLPAVSVFFLR